MIFVAIVFQIFVWLIDISTFSNLWIHDARTIEMSKLLNPRTDGGYFEHLQNILVCALKNLFYLREEIREITINLI